MRKASFNKVIASVVTAVVLGLLVYAGPAQAFSLKLDFENTEAEQGKKIELTATVDIDSGEALDIEEITLVLNGPEKVECTFDITGKMKSGVNEECHGINIKKIPYPQIEKGYGYSYSYNYGYGITEDLVYEITIHTQKFKVGEYETELRIAVNGETFSEPGETIKITEKLKGQEKHEQQEQNQETETNHGNENKEKNKHNENNGNSYGNVDLDDEEEENEEIEDEEQEEIEDEEDNNEENGNNGKSNENDNSNGNSGSNSNANANSNAGNGKGKNK